MAGGRIWRIRCSPGNAAPSEGSGSALAPTTPPAESEAMRAAPYLTEGAAQAIVNKELKDLMGAKVQLLVRMGS